MSRTIILLVVGARPNFVKVAPVYHALAALDGVEPRILNTGQHYDRLMAGAFIEQLALPAADFDLGVGSGSHAEQTAAVLVGTERVLIDQPPHALLVAGDVNSTLGAGLAAAKLGIPLAHLEAGLRSRDWSMPEEINRVLVDQLSSCLLCHSLEAVTNLAAEGIAESRVALVGNTMIDSLAMVLEAARATRVADRWRLRPGFVLVTLHRPALVDQPEALAAVLAVLGRAADDRDVVLPLHPRTRARIAAGGVDIDQRLRLVDPLTYLEFVALEEAAGLVVTDSGGVQEETSWLGTPCITYRTSTERPITVTHGTNRLVGTDPDQLEVAMREVLSAPRPSRPTIPLWDGHAGPRAAQAIITMLGRTTAAA